MTTRTRALLTVAILLAAPLLGLVAALALHGDLPDPLPRHWTAGGEVDGTWSFGVLTSVALGVSAVVAVASAVWRWRFADERARAGWATFGCYVAWLFTTLYVVTLVLSHGEDRAGDVDLPLPALIVAVALPGLVAAATYFLLPEQRPSPVRDQQVIEVAADEVVDWTGSAQSRVLQVTGMLLIGAGIAGTLLHTVIGLGIAAVGLAMWWTHQVTVRVTDAGVRISWGPFGWPVQRAALADLAGAESIELEPAQWGGWGYRMSTRGIGIVVRRGPAVVLQRRGKVDLAVTVDGADEAAGLVNGLVRRTAGDS